MVPFDNAVVFAKRVPFMGVSYHSILLPFTTISVRSGLLVEQKVCNVLPVGGGVSHILTPKVYMLNELGVNIISVAMDPVVNVELLFTVEAMRSH